MIRFITITLSIILMLALAFRAGIDTRPRVYAPHIYDTVNAIIPALPLHPLVDITPDGDPLLAARYCQQNDVKALFRDDLRAEALCAMYIVHLAKPYGEASAIDTLEQFLALEYAPCGDYAAAELQVMRALGIPSRLRTSTSHAWVEVQIAGVWETFDATTNVWLGVDGTYRMFYAPASDPDAPYAYRAYLNSNFNVLKLRTDEPFTHRGD